MAIPLPTAPRSPRLAERIIRISSTASWKEIIITDTSRRGAWPHGAELIGELVQYEDSYRLCYLRGPAGIVVALAEQIK